MNFTGTPAPPTDLEVITTQLYSVTVEVTAGNNGLEPQSLCVWYREQGPEEWKKGSGENSCSRNGVTEGVVLFQEIHCIISNDTYIILLVKNKSFYFTHRVHLDLQGKLEGNVASLRVKH